MIGIVLTKGMLAVSEEGGVIVASGKRSIDSDLESVVAWSVIYRTTAETGETQLTQETEDVQKTEEVTNAVHLEETATEETTTEETTTEISITEESEKTEIGNSYTYTYNGVTTVLKEGDVITDTIQSHYCACKICCGEKSSYITKGGVLIWNGMQDPFIVGCNWLPMGSTILIGENEYTVQDTGSHSRISKVGGVDVFVPAGHQACLNLGLIKNAPIKIVKINQ